MHLPPRVLYGLFERFVVFPYIHGARHSKLIVRASKLRALCDRPFEKNEDLSAPLVLGELYGDPTIFRVSTFVPQVMTGRQLHSFHVYGGAAWHLRWYRTRAMQDRSIRFEAGSHCTFSAHTQYYARELLYDLTTLQGGPHAQETRAHPSGRLPRDRGPFAS